MLIASLLLLTSGLDCPELNPLLVAQARVVATGRTAPLRRSDLESLPPGHDGIRFRFIKKLWGGGSAEHIVIAFHRDSIPRNVAAKMKSDGRRSDVLMMPARRWMNSDVFILTSVAQYGGPQRADRSCVVRVSALLGRIAEVNQQGDVNNHELPHSDEVRKLLDRLTATGQLAGAVDTLLRLGQAAVPPLIVLMDDRRRVSDELVLRNSGRDAFEAQRRYRPEVVVDAVAAILNELTGESFGDLYNGASEEERVATMRAWRAYLATVQKRL